MRLSRWPNGLCVLALLGGCSSLPALPPTGDGASVTDGAATDGAVTDGRAGDRGGEAGLADGGAHPVDGLLQPDGPLPPPREAGGGTPPGPPEKVTAAPGAPRTLVVTWIPPANGGSSPIGGYGVRGSPGNLFLDVRDPSTLRATFPSLQVGTAYTFTVTARNAAGEGPPSVPSAAVVVQDAPAAPTGLSACAGDGLVRLAFVPTPGATRHDLYWQTAPGVSKTTAQRVAAVTSPYVHTGLTNGTPYYAVVVAVGANGWESNPSNEVAARPTVELRDTLFVSSMWDNAIEIFDCFAALPTGARGGTRVIRGAATRIGAPWYASLAVDPKGGTIYSTNFGGNIVTIWNRAGAVNGNAAPARVLEGAATTLSQPTGVAIDRQRNRLYVVNRNGRLMGWSNASVVNGNTAPTVVVTGSSTGLGGNLAQLYLDEAADELYVSNYGNVLVFRGLGGLAGTHGLAPSRTISLLALGSSGGLSNHGVWVDPTYNRLYVSSRDATGTVYSVADATKLDGPQLPATSLTGSNAAEAMNIQVVNDTLFFLRDSAAEIRTWSSARTVTGNVAPTKTVYPSLGRSSALYYVP
ncbi:MAG: fibronectin type III domain-containing protein [Deltaproteobacteria bacterium]|nr:fibronectin type III domain-containing protein [Deltaproteobacteria bacterium]